MHNPASTPWGQSQTSVKLAPGIMDYTTASHGGIHLSELRRSDLGFRLGFWTDAKDVPAWYEEDCDWAIPYYVFHCDDTRPDGEATHESEALRTLAHWHPDLFARLVPGLSIASETWLASFDRADHRIHCTFCRMVANR